MSLGPDAPFPALALTGDREAEILAVWKAL